MISTTLTVAALAGLGFASPPAYPKQSYHHPGWHWPNWPSVYTPPAPTQTVYRPHHGSHSSDSSSSSSSSSSTSISITSSSSLSSTKVSSTASPTTSGIGPNACASVASLVAASPSVATPTVPAELAYECLNSIPFNQSAASALLESIEPYLSWQTTLEYVKDPPAEYAEHVQAPYDFWGTWEAIKANTSAGAYSSEYEFGWTLYRCFQLVHDGHFVIYPDSVTTIFSFGRTTPLVSVSTDGKSIPEPYVYADVLAASFGNASFTPSPVVEIDGQNATEYLLNWAEYGSLQDPDALYNNLFYIPAQVSLGSSGSGTGTFSGGGRGRWPYPGPSTTFTFANGTTVTNQNFARVLAAGFANITSGEDIYAKYFAVPEEAFDNAFVSTSSTSSATVATSTAGNSTASATAAVTATSTPAPGYPAPVVREKSNLNAGYYIDAPGYEDVAVLVIPSFVSSTSDEIPFQAVNTYFLEAARAANKTKLIIDVSANGGGTILQGYDVFKQLFPQILPYGATRFRAHEAFNLLGEQASYLSGLVPRSLSDNDTYLDIESSAFNYRSDANINYEPFTSWAEKYGPHAYGPEPDNFTSIIRWNLSDVLITSNSGGIDISGYGNRTNFTTSPFATEDIIIIYDGYCASTCTIFSELMRQQGGVKTIALGGRPSTDIIQAVGGVKGTNDFDMSTIMYYIQEFAGASNASLVASWENSVLANYTELPFYRTSASVVNARDGIREGDATGTPLQFVYEPADCRIFYTPEMVVDETAVWKTVADTVWGGGDACVAGSNKFYGNKTKRSLGESKRHAVRRDLDIQALYESLNVATSGATLDGDAVMII